MSLQTILCKCSWAQCMKCVAETPSLTNVSICRASWKDTPDYHHIVWFLPRRSAWWAAYRASNCLVHLRDCEEQPDDVRTRARDEQQHANIVRRRKAREKSERPLAATNAATETYHPASGQSTSVPGGSVGATQVTTSIGLWAKPYPSAHSPPWASILSRDVAAPFAGLSFVNMGSSVNHSIQYTESADIQVSRIQSYSAPASLIPMPPGSPPVESAGSHGLKWHPKRYSNCIWCRNLHASSAPGAF